mmetsp:Transcript_9780/g.44556  ORF Transcript_9780/g.44556 Transcript_9780/m.44556 type:complete len:276 (-) Transcript_9780:179-1006(-)
MDLLVAGPARNLLTLSIDRLVGDVIGEELKLPGLAVALLDRLHQRNLREENRVGWVFDVLEIAELGARSTWAELDSHGPRAFRCRVVGMPFRAKVENMVTCSGTGHLLVVARWGVHVRARLSRGWRGEAAVFVHDGERRYELAIGESVLSILAESKVPPFRDGGDHHGELGRSRRHAQLNRVGENVEPILLLAIDSFVGVPGRRAVNRGSGRARVTGDVICSVGGQVVPAHDVHVVCPVQTRVGRVVRIDKRVGRLVRDPNLVPVLIRHLVDVRE